MADSQGFKNSQKELDLGDSFDRSIDHAKLIDKIKDRLSIDGYFTITGVDLPTVAFNYMRDQITSKEFANILFNRIGASSMNEREEQLEWSGLSIVEKNISGFYYYIKGKR
jgi:hypothetical protein